MRKKWRRKLLQYWNEERKTVHTSFMLMHLIACMYAALLSRYLPSGCCRATNRRIPFKSLHISLLNFPRIYCAAGLSAYVFLRLLAVGFNVNYVSRRKTQHNGKIMGVSFNFIEVFVCMHAHITSTLQAVGAGILLRAFNAELDGSKESEIGIWHLDR